MKLVKWILALAIMLVGITFALLNPETVTVNFYVGEASISLAMALFASMLLGIVVGLLLGLQIWLQNKLTRTNVHDSDVQLKSP